MNELNKYNDCTSKTNLTNPELLPPEAANTLTFDLIIGILRRWYIVLGIFVLICLAGIPAIWILQKPIYSVTGFIRVAPILTNILSGEQERGEISNYQNFVNTEAIRITSGSVVERVADELANKNLHFFEEDAVSPVQRIKQIVKGSKVHSGPVNRLKQAISGKAITASADRQSELIKITMENKNSQEAKQIVDAFIRAYMAVAVSDSSNTENQKLNLLESEQELLFQKMENWRATILKLGQEFGGTSLNDRYDIKLQRVSSLLGELAKLESEKMRLEIEINLLDKSKDEDRDPAELLRIRQEYVNSDSRVNALSASITQFEQELIIARQRLAPQNPELATKTKLIEQFKERLAEVKKEAENTFDTSMASGASKSNEEKLLHARTALERIVKYEKNYREMLAKEDTEAIEVGRKQLIIEDLQDQLALAKERYDQYTRRIQELEIRQKLPARISIAQYADISSVSDKRIKLTLATVFGAMACGLMTAFLTAKADQRMWVPQDVTKSIDVRVIGTTAALKDTKKLSLPERVEEDFRTVCANLGLFSQTGQGVPKTLVIASPGSGDGKTTSAINLAFSLSKSGKKVLLLDGDLRKPDIAHFLNLPAENSRGLQEMISGKDFEQAVYHLPSTELNVLPADSNDALHALELLAQFHRDQYMDKICEKYDHIVIDTPPVLAFPDARLWAKMIGSVILTGMAGRTTGADMKKTSQLLSQIDVKVLGVILCNVQANKGYYEYVYNYYVRNGKNRKRRKRINTNKFLMPINEPENNTGNLNS